jgi:AcrR family transcriptional regulator
MNGMNQEDARIAYQAGDLFHQHGITATGVEALSKAAGISKRTLYERFGEQGWADRSRVRSSRRACVRDLHRPPGRARGRYAARADEAALRRARGNHPGARVPRLPVYACLIRAR